jgi:purine nucleosidase
MFPGTMPVYKECPTMNRFIIDTDMSADDAIALMMALRHPDIQVEAITTVAGSVPVAQATHNALFITELCDEDVPVYQGAGQPILREPVGAQDVYGKDGLGDLGTDPPQRMPQPEHAVDALVRLVMDAPGEHTLVTLGPLTNVALGLLKEPHLALAMRDVYVMGGTVNALGNVTPSAEFNVWADPEAAKRVFHSGAGVTMVGWELVWGDMSLDAKEIQLLQHHASPYARFAIDCNRNVLQVFERLLGKSVLALPGPIAMAMAIDRSICQREFLYATVETNSELTRGETVVDSWGVLGQPPNVRVCFDPDAAKFKQMLFDTLT